MTIITKPITADRKDEKEFLGDFEGPANIAVTIPHEASPIDTTEVDGQDDSMSMRSPRIKTGKFKFLVLILIGIVGITSGFCFFQTLHASQFRRGFCRLPYDARSSGDALVTGRFGNAHSPMARKDMEESLVSEVKGTVTEELVENQDGGIGLEYELDLEMETFEMTQMPELSRGKYLHDFKVNKTLILDTDNDRCFVMDLDRNEISPPKSLMEIIEKMKNGAFDLDLDEIRHDTRVITPPMANIDEEEYGYFIKSSCRDKITYRLELITKMLVKRSVEPTKYQFIEFGGKHMIKYNIVNLQDI